MQMRDGSIVNERNMNRVFGMILIIWAVLFARMGTQYFGNKWLPQSNEELIYDLTALMLMIAGSILFWQKRK